MSGDHTITLAWEPIRCACDTVIVEYLPPHFLRYQCRDRRCVGDQGGKVRIVYLDLRTAPPSVVALQDIEEEARNG